jgi:putative Holliday junction resolvase
MLVATDASPPRPPTQAIGTVLGFDFGERRIGVAVGDTLVGIAHPLQTIDAESNDIRFATIGQLIAEWKPSRLVVGLPSHLDGTEHALTLLCRKFARRLEGRFNLPVALVDERLTSAEAAQNLKQAGIGGRKQKPMLDQVAAQLILQHYLDHHATA